jgi:uncharacterized protein YkwD
VGAVMMRPNLALVPLEVSTSDGSFMTTFVPDEKGEWIVELLATGPRGPVPVAQLTVYAGVPLPTKFEGVWPPDESGIDSQAAAAEELDAFFHQERERFGLSPLTRDPRLDAIAKAHSEDMRDNGFVGHTSPTTGEAGARLRRAGYRAVGYAENVALNQSLWDAHAGLLRSLGHRRNILSRDLTHVGFGAASKDESWLVTQLYAVPRPVVADVDAARATILKRLQAARRKAGLRPLKHERSLEKAARQEAKARDPAPRSALNRVTLKRRGTAWVVVLSTVESFAPDEILLDAAWREVGIGLHQRDDRNGPDIQLVVLLSE